MSQHDLTIANDTRTNVRTDIQSALQALGSTSKSTARPATPYTGQLWIDDNTPSASVWTLYVYDGTDDISIGLIDSTANTFTATKSIPLAGGTSYEITGDLYFGQVSTAVPGASNSTLGAVLAANGSAHFSNNGSYVVNVNRNSDGTLVNIAKSGTTVGSISVSGSTTAYNTTSDAGLKQDIEPMAGAIARLKQIAPKRFRWRAKPMDPPVDGFIAQDMLDVMPEIVFGGRGMVDRGGKPVPLMMDHSKLVPLLAGALQEAVAKIEALEARVAALEAV